MPLIKEITGVLEPKRVRRWITVLEADDVVGEPKMEFNIGHLADDRLLSYLNKYKKKGQIDMTPTEAAEYRRNVLTDVLRNGEGWRGMTTGNAKRLCKILLEHPELIDENTPNEWPFDLADAGFIGAHMSAISFNDIVDKATDLEAFAQEKLLQTKKS